MGWAAETGPYTSMKKISEENTVWKRKVKTSPRGGQCSTKQRLGGAGEAVSFDVLSGEEQIERPCTFGLAFGSKGFLNPFKPTYFLAPGGRLEALSAR